MALTVKEYPRYAALQASMKRASRHVTAWSGIVYRSAPPKWAARHDFLSGTGSKIAGGRWNVPGSYAAIYASTTPELAMIESLAYQRRAGLPAHRALPLVFKAIAVDVERLLDLTHAGILADLGVAARDLRADAWWLARARGEESLTQAIGRAAHSLRAQAILSPSAHTTDHGLNLTVFPENIAFPSRINVLRAPRRP